VRDLGNLLDWLNGANLVVGLDFKIIGFLRGAQHSEQTVRPDKPAYNRQRRRRDAGAKEGTRG
jgi:hypothetical protein